MIDNQPDVDQKPSDAAPADERESDVPERMPQRDKPGRLGKLGVRKSPEGAPDPTPAGDSPERTKQGLRSRFKGGFKPAPRGSAARLPSAPDAGEARSGPGKLRSAVSERGDASARTKRSTGPDRPRSERERTPNNNERGARRAEAATAPAQNQAAPAANTVQPDGVRLSKIMAERGLCSRREADQIIERGWVSVDGRRVSQLGIRISPDAVVELAPEATARQAAQVTILLHKPVGYVSGQPEPEHVPAVTLIDAQTQFDRDVSQRFHHDHLRGLAPAGRLDIDSTGLLVLTQNGRIARQLIGDDSKVEKEYLVRVEGQLDDQGLALLNHGLELDGRKLRPAKVEWVNEDQLRFVLREGRKRQIRRMCELVGLSVVGLKRVRIGRVRLGDLPMGQWRFLREDEQFS